MNNKTPIHYIQNLDLQYLVSRLVNKHKWIVEEAQETVRKYKNFLILSFLYPDVFIVPTKPIDELWHDHILHTENYTRDCHQIFGQYLHHQPSTDTPEEKTKLDNSYSKTANLYEKEFGEPYMVLSPTDLALFAFSQYENDLSPF